eukprot:1160786-Pelagomonas_calceolata.AAC.22
MIRPAESSPSPGGLVIWCKACTEVDFGPGSAVGHTRWGSNHGDDQQQQVSSSVLCIEAASTPSPQ